MLFYEGPRDIAKHMQELEQRFDLSGYDHSDDNLTGWRREMTEAQIQQNEADLSDDLTKPSLVSRLISTTSAWSRPAVVSTD